MSNLGIDHKTAGMYYFEYFHVLFLKFLSILGVPVWVKILLELCKEHRAELMVASLNQNKISSAVDEMVYKLGIDHKLQVCVR